MNLNQICSATASARQVPQLGARGPLAANTSLLPALTASERRPALLPAGRGRTPQVDLAGQSAAGEVGVRVLRLPEGMAADDAVGGEVTYSWGGTTLILVRKDANLGVYGW